MQLSLIGLTAFILFFTLRAGAAPTSVLNSDVRALGMGDAYTAIVDNDAALFYNPAGLARVAGINIKVFGIHVGGNMDGVSAAEDVTGLQSDDPDEFSDAVNNLYGKNIWIGTGGEVALTVPMVGLAVYNHSDIAMRFDNPVNPQISTDVVNDYGYVMGLGIPISPFMHIGADLKYIKRSGSRDVLGASSVADLDTDQLYSNLTRWGRGYGADMGVNFVIPAPIFSATIAAAWKNIGEMHFRSNSGTAVPSEQNEVNLGLGLKFNLGLIAVTPAIDFKYLTRSDLQLGRKLNFGVEVDLPILDLRAGFHEGYYTYGVGVNLGLVKVEAATYGVELGDYPGQIEDRRYVAQLTMEFGIGNFTASGVDNGSGSSGGGKGGKGGGSKSLWGGSGRLKQRR